MSIDAIFNDVATSNDASGRPQHGSPVPTTPTRVLFTQRAYTAILCEVMRMDPDETGGILLGYMNGPEWVVVESTDPGPQAIHQSAYFKYDRPYVSHLANRICDYYDPALELLGLWHRHPGSYDSFSGTDDETNWEYATRSSVGAISGIVNVDPNPRLSLFHVTAEPLQYASIPFLVLTDEESNQCASLRNANALAAELAIESDAKVLQPRAADVLAVPECCELSPSEMSGRIDDAIACSAHTLDVDKASYYEWTDQLIADALSSLDADMHFLGEQGMPVGMRCIEREYLELFADDGRQETICVLFLASPPNGRRTHRRARGGLRRFALRRTRQRPVCHIMGSPRSPKAVAYSSGYIKSCYDCM